MGWEGRGSVGEGVARLKAGVDGNWEVEVVGVE